MQVLIQRLQDAIGSGELINIIYHGGSEPGAARMILPIKIEGDKVRAKCYASSKVKAFSIEKIEFAADDISDYTGTHQEPASLEDAIAPYLDELKAAGWGIEITSDSVGLFTFFKNGKRRKASTVSISYYLLEDYNEFDEIDESEKSEEIDAVNHRPWHIRGQDYSGQAYKHLSKAVTKFISLARELKP